MSARTIAALFGALLFGILVPILYPLAFGLPLEGFSGVLVLAAAGVVLGALLGASRPRLFGFVLEVILDV